MGTLIDLPDLPDLPGPLPDLPDLPAIGNPLQAIADSTSEGIGRALEFGADLAGNIVIAAAGVGLLVLGVRKIFGA